MDPTMSINFRPTFSQEVLYKECKHNLSASLGRVTLDGCREFLKADDDEDGSKESLQCAACGCHRSFHRKEMVYNPIVGNIATPLSALPANLATGVELLHAGKNGEEELGGRRRRRTVYTPEQKNKLVSFAQQLGWKPQKHNYEQVNNFCMEMGMDRRTFMVWLGNNRRKVHQINCSSSAN